MAKRLVASIVLGTVLLLAAAQAAGAAGSYRGRYQLRLGEAGTLLTQPSK